MGTCYLWDMTQASASLSGNASDLPDDPDELRTFTAALLSEIKRQAILIEKLRHQLAGHRAARFGTSAETLDQLQLALETSEVAAAAMTARLRLPSDEMADKPRRRNPRSHSAHAHRADDGR